MTLGKPDPEHFPLAAQPDERRPIIGGITNTEAGAIAQGVREMAITIRGLREDLARVEKARASWASEVVALQEALRQRDDLLRDAYRVATGATHGAAEDEQIAIRLSEALRGSVGDSDECGPRTKWRREP